MSIWGSDELGKYVKQKYGVYRNAGTNNKPALCGVGDSGTVILTQIPYYPYGTRANNTVLEPGDLPSASGAGQSLSSLFSNAKNDLYSHTEKTIQVTFRKQSNGQWTVNSFVVVSKQKYESAQSTYRIKGKPSGSGGQY